MDEANDEGFWSFVRRTRPGDSFSEETEQRIDKWQRRVCTKGFGVSYEWITEPHVNLRWASVDGFFRGVPKEDFDEICGKFPDAELFEGEDELCSDRPYHDGYEELVPDHLLSNSNLPKTKDMEREYDIIFTEEKLTNS